MAATLLPLPTSSPTSSPSSLLRSKCAAKCSRGTINFHQRRELVCGLIIAAGVGSSPESALAAKKRPPPPPSPEKKADPNVSGALAKVLASKKRKEAMKEAMAKLREKGKVISEPSQ